jgi:hypothetical protein
VAIDLMVMPLSRYWAGDFITPAMRAAWQHGLSYAIVRPNQPRQDLPPGIPFGGPEAAAHRHDALEVVNDLQRQLGLRWNDASDQEPTFYRPDTSSFGALREAAAASERRPGFLGRLVGKRASQNHLAHATIFVPGHVPQLLSGDGFVLGSAIAAGAELHRINWPLAAAEALDSLRNALDDAKRLRLPLVIDA